jgi:hypothetical protein
MKKSSLVIIALFVCSRCFAVDIPLVIKEGFDAYKEKGLAAGFERWLRGSALDGDTTSRISVLGGITQIEAAYGKIESYEVIASYRPAERLQRIYTVSYHAKGPVFGYFDLFKSDNGWIVYMFNVNTKPQEILPRELIDKKG